MSLYDTFATDTDLEKTGIFVEYGETDDGKPIRFRIARAGGANTEFEKVLEKLTRPYRKAIQSGMIAKKKADEIYMLAFIQTVLLGWENVQDRNGKEMEFCQGNAIKLFGDLPDLYQDLREQANTAALFREVINEASLGNSGTSLPTASSKDQ